MMRVAYNFVASEAGWFACVLGAAHGKPWIGPLVWAVCMPLLAMLAARWNSEVRVRRPEYILDDWRVNSGA